MYLDNIIIWSQSMAEHIKNMAKVLDALCAMNLYCSPKKTFLFCNSIDFLGHYISVTCIKADSSKAQHILDWPALKSTTNVRAFLELMQCLAQFLPWLTELTQVLTLLTMKNTDHAWPSWSTDHQTAFDTIKVLITS